MPPNISLLLLPRSGSALGGIGVLGTWSIAHDGFRLSGWPSALARYYAVGLHAATAPVIDVHYAADDIGPRCELARQPFGVNGRLGDRQCRQATSNIRVGEAFANGEQGDLCVYKLVEEVITP